jgi:hypothetical protein
LYTNQTKLKAPTEKPLQAAVSENEYLHKHKKRAHLRPLSPSANTF